MAWHSNIEINRPKKWRHDLFNISTLHFDFKKKKKKKIKSQEKMMGEKIFTNLTG